MIRFTDNYRIEKECGLLVVYVRRSAKSSLRSVKLRVRAALRDVGVVSRGDGTYDLESSSFARFPPSFKKKLVATYTEELKTGTSLDK